MNYYEYYEYYELLCINVRIRIHIHAHVCASLSHIPTAYHHTI